MIPSGTFAMGSGENEREADANEIPRHQVTISKPFYLGKYEVTLAQWEAVMGSSPYTLPRSNPYYSYAKQLGRYAWFGEDFASGSHHAVGQKEPNGWGLYDVHGNVWEWVHDWYGERYYANRPSVDPKGPPSGSPCGTWR